MPLTASSIYGTFAANPVTDTHGVVYLQDLASNVFAPDLRSGRVLWTHSYNSQDIGPNGVVVADVRVYGATAAFAFALDPKTGRELWRNAHLIPPHTQAAGGELASGFGIDMQPQVANGKVYIATAALLGGGIAYALDARRKGQIPEVVAFRLGAHGSLTAPQGATVNTGSGGSANGASVFAANCSSRHTLAAAHANETVGLNLDQLKPPTALVRRQVTNGGGGMPAFGGRLSPAQINAVAKYVSSVAGR